MGSHAKPRTTGRKTALGALALGATLTGVGLTAAALDPATAVLTANGADEGAATQLSGLSSPVSLSLSPAADAIPDLSSAPFQSTDAASAAKAAKTLAGAGSWTGTTYDPTGGTVDSTGYVIRRVTSGAASTGTERSVKPIVASTPGSTSTKSSGSSGSSGTSSSSGSSGSGYTGKHAKPGSAAPPSDITPLTSVVTSTVATVTSTTSKVLPVVESLVSKIPVVSTVVQDTGLLDSSSSSASGTSADPVSSVTGVVGSLPLVGALLGGSGNGQSTVTVPGVSAIAGLL